MGQPTCPCAQERRRDKGLCGLETVEWYYTTGCIPIAQHWRHIWLFKWCISVLHAWPRVWVLADTHGWVQQRGDCFYLPQGSLPVQENALWTDECSCEIPEVHEQNFGTIHWKILFRIFRQYCSFQPNPGGAWRAPPLSLHCPARTQPQTESQQKPPTAAWDQTSGVPDQQRW